jgi:zinc protease
MALASLRSLSAADKREPALKLFSEVVGKPTFPPTPSRASRTRCSPVSSTRNRTPANSRRADEAPVRRPPYAHSSDGTRRACRRSPWRNCARSTPRPTPAGNVVIALVGDLSRAEAEAIAAQVSGALPKGPALAKIAQPQEPKASVNHIEFPSKQTNLLLAQLGIDRDDPDYAALSMGNQILGGGGFGTRLMSEVREKRGLTYGVYPGSARCRLAARS